MREQSQATEEEMKGCHEQHRGMTPFYLSSLLSLSWPREFKFMKSKLFLGRSLGFLQRDGPGPAMYSKPEVFVRWYLPHSSKYKSSFGRKCLFTLLNIDLWGNHMWALICKKQILSSALSYYCFLTYWDLCLSVEFVIVILLFHKQCLNSYSPVTQSGYTKIRADTKL